MACRTFANESMDAVRREMIKYAAQIAPVADRPPTPERSFDVVEEAVQSAAAAKQEAQAVVSALQRGLGLVAQKDGPAATDVLKGALRTVQTMQRNLDDRAQSSGAMRMLRQDFSDSKERMLSLYESAAARDDRNHVLSLFQTVCGSYIQTNRRRFRRGATFYIRPPLAWAGAGDAVRPRITRPCVVAAGLAGARAPRGESVTRAPCSAPAPGR